MSTPHSRRALATVAGALLAIGGLAPAAHAMTDLSGQSIANTGDPQAQVVGGPSVIAKLADPTTPANDDPGTLASLGSPGNPEDDLAGAMDAMAAAASAGDRAGATRDRQLA